MMGAFVRSRSRLAKSLFVSAFFGLIGFSAQAQGSIFCPTTIPGVNTGTGFALANGLCTNNNVGAVSTAALSSQALGDVHQSVTQQTTTAALDAISARRKEEAARCPEGFERSNDGTCHRIIVSEPESRVSAPAAHHRQKPGPAAPLTVKAPVVAIDPGYRFGAWVHGFGDYEQRNFTASSGTTSGGGVGAGAPQPVGINFNQVSNTGGVIGGVDVTVRNLLAGNDGLIVGILSGYLSTTISGSATSAPTGNDPTGPGFGASSTKIHISGPSVGAYYTYFNGPFSNDTTIKADFLSINESFVESLAFNGTINLNSLPTNALVTGSGSANVTNFVVAQNFQYRFPISATLWVEPTVGYTFTNSSYDSGAAALGLQ